ncbi:RICIN domain-containing protein, partial [Roseisolibacter sp. H3M3-2]|uniref:RICIN domain-containing protein n=1 Tax=Roseisolibacter sp. H3M3-2 TaxID=3031323 RepID=UPI0023DA5E66
GAPVVLRACDGSASQRWTGGSTAPAPNPAPAQVLPGTLPNGTGQGCLQPKGGTIAGGNTVAIAPCAAGVVYQQWTHSAVGVAGEASPGASHCLDAMGDAAGSAPKLLYCQGTASQRWTLTAAGELRSANGLCATSIGVGAPVVLRACDGSPAQHWTGAEVSTPTPPPVVMPAPTAASVLAYMGAANVPTVSAMQARGGAWATYETVFSTLQEVRWLTDGLTTDANYYDRAMIYYVWWARTGNTTYLERGHQLAVAARTYMEASNYQVQPYLMMVDGVALHAILTGDTRSSRAVAQLADYLGGSNSTWPEALAENGNGSVDSRSQARVLSLLLDAHLLGVASPVGDDWRTRLRVTLDYILQSQSSDGAYRWSNQCWGNKPFMTGMLNDALIRYYELFEQDPRIPAAVKRSVDYMWNNNWVPATQGFLYQDGPCTESASADLNQLVVSGFGFVARQTGDASYFTRGDAVFAGAVNYSFLSSAKHFNQNYTAAYHYLATRF